MSGRSRQSWAFAEGDQIVPGRHAVRLLGGGRHYEAYLAWDDELYALIVAKMVRPGLVDEAAARLTLEREADVLASLNHPTVVRSFGAVLDGDRPHLALEFIDGPRLSTLIRRHGVIVEQALSLALELCSALHYMHGRGFVHLDVKPRNVIMGARPRLIDLSVATRRDAVRTLPSPTGTDAYMAPEQCDPTRFHEIGPASDVWGLGVTLYEALSRARPFPDGRQDGAVATESRYPQLVVRPRPLPRRVPQLVGSVILACLERRPEDRPAPAEIARTLEPYVDALPGPRLGRFRPDGTKRRSVFEL